MNGDRDDAEHILCKYCIFSNEYPAALKIQHSKFKFWMTCQVFSGEYMLAACF